MVSFSDDVDILKYEPVLFGELHLPGQVLAAGTGGTLSGTTFTAGGADFVSAQVSAGGVAHLSDSVGVIHFTHVSGVHKMIHHLFTVHNITLNFYHVRAGTFF